MSFSYPSFYRTIHPQSNKKAKLVLSSIFPKENPNDNHVEFLVTIDRPLSPQYKSTAIKVGKSQPLGKTLDFPEYFQ